MKEEYAFEPSYVHTKTVKVIKVGSNIVELEDGYWMTRDDYWKWQKAYERYEEVWMDNNKDRKQIIVIDKPILPSKEFINKYYGDSSTL